MIMMLAGCLNSQPGSPAPTDGGLATSSDGGSADGGTNGGMSFGTMICSATLSLSGQWVEGNLPPTDFPGGCWPDGTWSFTATVTQNGCASQPDLAALYRFQVMEDVDYNVTITFLNDPTNTSASLRISGGEGGVCGGAFLLFSADGKTMINLRPALQADNSINGRGEYQVWTADQR